METFPNDVRIVLKNNALAFHKRAMPAAIGAMAAHKQGKFWEYHDKLFANMKALADADLERYATEIGVDLAKWKTDIKDPTIKAGVQADMDLAAKVNARGTPNFFVNGRNLRGAVPYEQFETLIKEELIKAKALVAAGTAKADVYAKIIANGKTFEPLEEKVHVMTHEGRPFKGNPNGDVVIYEYSDFQ
jgi:protein-disulfide isomerase